MSLEPEVIPFQQLLEALIDEEIQFNNRYLFRLSDLDDKELNSLKEIWGEIPLSRRKSVLSNLLNLGEENLILSYEAIGRFVITDADAGIRELGVRILKGSENANLIPKFMRLLERDTNEDVRATCASALSRFVYLGEVEKISRDTLRRVEDCLLHALQHSQSDLVKQRSLEAIGYSSRPEVPPLIENALQSGDTKWIKSALSAIGRSIDERWEDVVLFYLNNRLPSLRAEAAKAAGELEISTALPRLIELADDSDDDVRRAAIWSLSQISGEGVKETLEELWELAEEDGEIDLLEAALENLEFKENIELFTLFEFPDDEQEDLDEDIYDAFEFSEYDDDNDEDLPD